MLDAFKSIGFDHVRHTNYEQFAERMKDIKAQGLEPKIDEHLDDLVKLGVLDSKIDSSGDEQAKTGLRAVYNSFFRFWRDATEHLIESATFTLEDQKYVAYLDERQKLEEGRCLSGAARYDHVLVDEFQDINPLDLALIKAIIDRNKATITIVGDDDQALFEWRGATPEYILNPGRYFDREFATFTLSRNYRSPANVVNLSQKLIAHNKRRVNKSVHPVLKQKAEIEVRSTDDLNEAMEYVYAEAERAIKGGQSPSRVAIIGRQRSQIIPYQVYFASKNVSFCAAEDLQVFLGGAFDKLLAPHHDKERGRPQADAHPGRGQLPRAVQRGQTLSSQQGRSRDPPQAPQRGQSENRSRLHRSPFLISGKTQGPEHERQDGYLHGRGHRRFPVYGDCL